jgi:flagellar motor switch protein FliG
MTIKGSEKAAILIMTLQDENVIKDIFSKLDPSEIYEISLAMTNLGNIESDQVEKVLIEFAHDLNQSLQLVGNVRTTERFLKQVLDDPEYNKVIDKIKHANTSSTWDMISNIDDLSVAQFIKHEYPQTAALILSKLPGYKAAKILKLLSKEYSVEVLKRMVHLDSIEPEILTRVERVIENEIGNMSSQFNKPDNISIVAEIFNNLSKDDEGIFMAELRDKAPDAAQKIAKTMLSFDDLLLITPDAMLLITQKIDNNILITALSGAKQEIRDLFLGCMSQRVARMIIDEIDSGNRFAKKDVMEAQAYILRIVKGMINDGSITLDKNI